MMKERVRLKAETNVCSTLGTKELLYSCDPPTDLADRDECEGGLCGVALGLIGIGRG